jgi:tetratricopeptide (TPR) repeat protein
VAEGLLGGLLGGEEEAAEAEAGEGRVSAEAFAAALAEEQAKHDPEVARAAAEFLRDQSTLLKAQTAELEEQRALRLRHLQNQSREGKLRRTAQRLRLGMQVIAGAIFTAFAVAIGVTVWQAAHDHSLVVEAFSVPPDLAQKGLTGPVLSGLLLDDLAEIDAKTQSARAAGSYQNSWGGDIKIEIPETGVSLGELNRYLKEWLGHETRIGGALFHTPAGVRLVVRAGEFGSSAASGLEADLDALVAQEAEAVFAATQPYRYSKYLEEQGRTAQALAVARKLATSDAPPSERAWAYAQISNLVANDGDFAGGAVAAREALRLSPRLLIAEINLEGAEQLLGHDEAALHSLERSSKLLAGIPKDLSPEARATLGASNAAPKAEYVGDYLTAAQIWAEFRDRPEFLRLKGVAADDLVVDRAKDHDVFGAQAAFGSVARPDVDAVSPAEVAAADDVMLPLYELAVSRGDWAAALSALDRDMAMTQGRGLLGEDVRQRFLRPRRALALARLGRQPEAEAEIADTPLDCANCVRIRGLVAAQKRDWREADRWFAQAVRQAPSLPFAYTDWGGAVAARGDLNGAERLYRTASEKGPRFADPLKGWGDVLARQGRWNEALAKYDEALKGAPAWAALRQARDAAAQHRS